MSTHPERYGTSPFVPSKRDARIRRQLHNLSGNSVRDDAESIRLCAAVTDFALEHLSTRGTMVLKHLTCTDADHFRIDVLEKSFRHVRFAKPKASRGESREGYWIALGLITTPTLDYIKEAKFLPRGS